jgi:hypothetical protein
MIFRIMMNKPNKHPTTKQLWADFQAGKRCATIGRLILGTASLLKPINPLSVVTQSPVHRYAKE